MLESEHCLFSVQLGHISVCLLARETQLAADDSAYEVDRFLSMCQNQSLSRSRLREMYISNELHLLLVVSHSRNNTFAESDESLLNIRIALGCIAIWYVEIDVIEITTTETHELATPRDLFRVILRREEPVAYRLAGWKESFNFIDLFLECLRFQSGFLLFCRSICDRRHQLICFVVYDKLQLL